MSHDGSMPRHHMTDPGRRAVGLPEPPLGGRPREDPSPVEPNEDGARVSRAAYATALGVSHCGPTGCAARSVMSPPGTTEECRFVPKDDALSRLAGRSNLVGRCQSEGTALSRTREPRQHAASFSSLFLHDSRRRLATADQAGGLTGVVAHRFEISLHAESWGVRALIGGSPNHLRDPRRHSLPDAISHVQLEVCCEQQEAAEPRLATQIESDVSARRKSATRVA
jgi:hypothetical protein